MEEAFKRGMAKALAILPFLTDEDPELPEVVMRNNTSHTAEEIESLLEPIMREAEEAEEFEAIQIENVEHSYHRPSFQELQRIWEMDLNKPVEDLYDFPF